MPLLALFIALEPAAAQHHLLGADAQGGGFGGPVLKLGAVGGTTALFLGVRGGMILPSGPEQQLSIGGGMYGMMSAVEPRGPEATDPARHLRFGYGGLELEYLLRPHDVLHLSAVSLFGVGQAGFDDAERFDGHGFGHMWGRGAAVFVAEPGVNLTLNVAPSFRLSLGGSYRFVGGTRQADLRDTTLSGWSGQLAFSVGRFSVGRSLER